MSSSIERFAQRQAIRESLEQCTQLVVMPCAAHADRLAKTPVDTAYLQRVELAAPLGGPRQDVSVAVVDARLSGLAERFHAQRVDRLFNDTQRAALQAIAGPFGVGKMLSAYDKTGGSVDTIHNARRGVYATEEAQQAYDDRGAYNKYEYHQDDPRYRKTNEQATKDRLEGNLKDSYTEDMLGLKESQSLDHTIAAKEIHNDPGRVLAKLNGATLANDPTNLNSTTQTTNSAMQQKSATEYVAWLEMTRPARDARLAELRAKEATGEPLGKADAQELAKLTEQEKIAANPEPLLEADRVAREAYEKSVSDAYYKSPEFRRDCLKTSAVVGGRAAFQAAMGAVLVEVFAGVFDEVRDWYQNGAQEETVATELKRRLKRVGVRVGKQWKGVLAAAGGGFISGFLANLLTVLINAFVTTAKRTGRMIREGATSLITSCKCLIVRPQEMTLTEGLHEASKVLVGGAIVVGGVMLEEAISLKLHAVPFIAPFADLATAVIVGATTAVATTMAVYLVDKADAFGVNKWKLMEHMNEELDASLGLEEQRRADWVSRLEGQLG